MNIELAYQLTGANWNSGLFFHLADRFTGYSKLFSYSQNARCPTLFDTLLSWLKGLLKSCLQQFYLLAYEYSWYDYVVSGLQVRMALLHIYYF
jgi:hypothetical protein